MTSAGQVWSAFILFLLVSLSYLILHSSKVKVKSYTFGSKFYHWQPLENPKTPWGVKGNILMPQNQGIKSYTANSPQQELQRIVLRFGPGLSGCELHTILLIVQRPLLVHPHRLSVLLTGVTCAGSHHWPEYRQTLTLFSSINVCLFGGCFSDEPYFFSLIFSIS